MTTLPKHIVFIDGDCILCNRAVIQIDERDSTKILHYASLTSDTAKDLLPADLTEKQKTFVFLVDGENKGQITSIALCIDDNRRLSPTPNSFKIYSYCYL